MQRAVLNRATMRVAETTEVSGRVTADEMNPGIADWKRKKPLAPRQNRVCALVAATLILPALAYAQNDQGVAPVNVVNTPNVNVVNTTPVPITGTVGNDENPARNAVQQEINMTLTGE
jgi:hypothetical protein